MTIDLQTLSNLSRKERAAEFAAASTDDRAAVIDVLLPGEAADLRRVLSEEDVAKHVSEFPIGSTKGPFGESLPAECVADGSGFGTFDAVRDECVDCPVCVECFCRKDGRYFSSMVAGVAEYRERLEDAAARASKSIAGQAAKNANTFEYLSEIYVGHVEADRFSTDQLLRPDGTLIIDEFSKQVTGGVKGREKFVKGGDGSHLIRFPYFRLSPSSNHRERPLGVPWRFIDIEGESAKMLLSDFFDHCKAHGDVDRQIVMFLFWGSYGAFLPIGWRYRLDKKVTDSPRYVWAEYVDPSDASDVDLVSSISGGGR